MAVSVRTVGDQLVPCWHPDCLDLAEFVSGAFWVAQEQSFVKQAPTCLTHVGWAVQQLLRELQEASEPVITVARFI